MATFADRFWANVDRRQEGECWPWRRSRKGGGYGQVRHGNRVRRAHVVAWELTNGPVPNGLNVLHACDNPPCCNPAHLFVGTQAVNVADMDSKGRDRRWRVGESSRVVLTEELVRLIRSRRNEGWTHQRISDEVGVSQSQVCRVLNRKHWAHVN